jgi:amidase
MSPARRRPGGDPKLANNVTETSALAAERLEKAGAILFGKTNVPLMLADWQSYNAKCGAKVKEIEPKLDTVRLHEVYVLLLRAATSVRTSEEDVKRWGQTRSEIGAAKEPYLDLMVRGNKLLHRDWLKLNNERYELRRAFAAFFADWDVLLCPAAASAAWPHDQEGERWRRKIAVNGNPVASTDQLFWAGYASLVYLPVTVGPAGFAKSGLPVGYQAIAASGRDKTATAFCRFIEKEIVGFIPPPGFD